MPGTVLGVSGKFYSDRQRLLKVLWDHFFHEPLLSTCYLLGPKAHCLFLSVVMWGQGRGRPTLGSPW